MAESQKKQLQKGRMGIFDSVSAADDLIFQYNPHEIDRDRRASYGSNAAALADFPNSPKSGVQSREWVRNEPEDFQFDLMLHEVGDKDVEASLKKLDDFMKPDQNTLQPKDLFLKMGSRSDRIRILQKSVKEKRYTPDLKVQEALVTLKVFALTSRSG